MTVGPGDTRDTYLISRCHTVLGLGLGTQAWSTGAVSRMGIKPALVCKHRHNHQSGTHRISKAWTLCDHYIQRHLHGSSGRTKKNAVLITTESRLTLLYYFFHSLPTSIPYWEEMPKVVNSTSAQFSHCSTLDAVSGATNKANSNQLLLNTV